MLSKLIKKLNSSETYPLVINFGIILLIIVAIKLGWSSKYLSNINLLQTFIFGFLVFDQLYDLKKEQKTKNISRKNLIFFISTIIIFLINLLNTVYFYNTLTEIFRYSSIIIFFYLITKYFNKNKDVINITKLLLFTALVGGIAGFFSIFSLNNITTGAISFFGWRNTFGGFIVLLLPLSLTFYLSDNKDKKWSKLSLIASITLLINLYFTFSQASWLAFLASLFLMLFLLGKVLFKKENLNKLATLTIATILIIVAIMQIKNQQAPSRTNTTSKIIKASKIQPLGVSNRIDYWLTSLEIFKNYPITGIGLGNFNIIYSQYQRNIWSYTKDPHNILLLILAETGIIGAILIIFLLYNISNKIFLIHKHSDKHTDQYYLFVGLVGGVTASFLHNLLDFDWLIYTLLLLWILQLATIFIIYQKMNIQKKETIITIKHFNFVNTGLIIISFLAILTLGSFIISNNYYTQIKNLKFKDAELEQQLAKKAAKYNSLLDKNYHKLALSYLNKIKQKQGNPQQNSKLFLQYSLKALELNRQNAFNHYFVGTTYVILNKLDLAKTHLKKAIALDKYNRPRIYTSLIETYKMTKEEYKLQKTIDDVLEKFPEENIQKIFLNAEKLAEYNQLIELAKREKKDIE